MTEEQIKNAVDAIIKDADKDGDGVVDFEEYLASLFEAVRNNVVQGEKEAMQAYQASIANSLKGSNVPGKDSPDVVQAVAHNEG